MVILSALRETLYVMPNTLMVSATKLGTLTTFINNVQDLYLHPGTDVRPEA